MAALIRILVTDGVRQTERRAVIPEDERGRVEIFATDTGTPASRLDTTILDCSRTGPFRTCPAVRRHKQGQLTGIPP